MLSKMLRGSVNNTTNPAGATDANFNQVSLLLHGDGTNGAQNNTFLDSSTNNFSVTRNGNTTQGTNTPFSQAAGYWSNNFNGTTDYLQCSSSAFALQANDFTVEMWIYWTTIPTTDTAFIGGVGSGSGSSIGIYYYANNITLLLSGGSQYLTFGSKNQLTINQWNHLAITRSGNSHRCFINGVLDTAGTVTYSGNWGTPTTTTTIGAQQGNANYFNGYLNNVRVILGTALYTANFTPPTTPLTAITNTSLLTCQSNYFKDNSSNNFTLTATGTPSVQPFSPFAPTSAYSTSVNGGSMYFDGSGDYLTTSASSAFSFGSGNWTVECWLYLTQNVDNTGIFQVANAPSSNNAECLIYGPSAGGGSLVLYSSSNGAGWDVSSGASIGTVNLYTWNHVAISKNGSSINLFVNGNLNNTVTFTGSYSGTFEKNWVGKSQGNNYFNGYISNARIVVGTAVYTSAFTPPTAPLTAITNTSLLLSGTNAGIYDNAIKNDLETVGNAQVSTSVVKYGTGSMKFNGTTDYLTLPSTPNLAMGFGNFTWECWVYTSAGSSFQGFISSREGSGNTGLYLGTNNATLQPMVYNDTNPLISGSINITANTWTHVALVRNSGTLTLYIGGTSAGSVSNTTNLTSTFYKIGCDGKASQGLFLNGYIDDLRITKGVARYTANFTPPTQAFPNQ